MTGRQMRQLELVGRQREFLVGCQPADKGPERAHLGVQVWRGGVPRLVNARGSVDFDQNFLELAAG
jgi:hypothetical protein